MVKWRYVLVALLLVPLIDATLLVFVAGEIGGVTTVLLVVLTGLIGTLLVRAEGRHTIKKVQRSLAAGEPPTNELLDGAFLIAAGAFLLTPGLVTDALGFLFVVPVTRAPLRVLLKKYVVVPALDERTGGFVTGNVYVGGFPNPDEQGGFDDGDRGGFDDGDRGGFSDRDGFGGDRLSGDGGGDAGSGSVSGGTVSGGSDGTRRRSSGSNDDTVDITDDEYTVE
jgi:UPF0716 protein FxsA